MRDRDLQRYSRHILLPAIDIAGQQRLLDAHALVVGAGGLGAPALIYLASAGVGRLTICDGDAVDLTNLQRQVVHRESAIGVNKAESARRTLAELNSDCTIDVVPRRLAADDLPALVGRADVVVDASDNFATRRAINAACVRARKPLVSGAAIRFAGQVAVFDLRYDDAACYACFLPEPPAAAEEPCAVMGVFAPLTGIIGCMQAAEVIRLLVRPDPARVAEVVLFDASELETQRLTVQRNPACAVCARRTSTAGAR